jgi:hypothetical protein
MQVIDELAPTLGHLPREEAGEREAAAADSAVSFI